MFRIKLKMNLILYLFLLSLLRISNGLIGDNICREERLYNETSKVSYKVPFKIRTLTWCMNFPPRCSKYHTEMRDSWKLVTEIKTRNVTTCCPGYMEIKDRCSPICQQGCGEGVCVSPNICECPTGYTGALCSIKCLQHDVPDNINCKTVPTLQTTPNFFKVPTEASVNTEKSTKYIQITTERTTVALPVTTTQQRTKIHLTTTTNNIDFKDYVTKIPSTEAHKVRQTEQQYNEVEIDTETNNIESEFTDTQILEPEDKEDNDEFISVINNVELPKEIISPDYNNWPHVETNNDVESNQSENVFHHYSNTSENDIHNNKSNDVILYSGLETQEKLSNNNSTLKINDNYNENGMNLISSISVAAGISIAIIFVAVLIVLAERLKRAKSNAESNKIELQNQSKHNLSNRDLMDAIQMYSRSVFNMPLSDPPAFENPNFSPIFTDSYTRRLSLECPNCTHTLSKHAREVLEGLYDHPPSLACCRSSTTFRPCASIIRHDADVNRLPGDGVENGDKNAFHSCDATDGTPKQEHLYAEIGLGTTHTIDNIQNTQ